MPPDVIIAMIFFMVKIMTFTACIGFIIGGVFMAGFATAAVMAAQGKPSVIMRIIVPSGQAVAQPAIAHLFIFLMFRRHTDRTVAIAAFTHVRHFESDEVFMTVGAVQVFMGADHEERLVVVGEC